jgi:hypothetical protein
LAERVAEVISRSVMEQYIHRDNSLIQQG